MASPRVIIVGAGLAGLSAACRLEELGCAPLLLEKSNQVGGRIRTEKHQGFLLDEGFQVVLDSYPELSSSCKNSLNLKKFNRGARYRSHNDWKLVDSYSLLKWEKDTWKGLFSLGKSLLTSRLETSNMTTEAYIHTLAAPEDWTDDFLAPFLRGVFIDKTLNTHASRFLELAPYFAFGNACLPAEGMQAIPRWFAAQLKTTEIRLNAEVVEAKSQGVVLSTGEKLKADAVLLALPLPQLATLVHVVDPVKSCSTSCDYFSIDGPLLHKEPILWLDGRKESPINNFSFLSVVQPTYAPIGKHLLSASAIGPDFPTERDVREYLCYELKIPTNLLQPLGRRIVVHALPSQAKKPLFDTKSSDGCFIAGEGVDPPSINDAIASGKKRAEAMCQLVLK